MSAKTIKAIAFDFDGTLVDSNPVKREGFYVATSDIAGAKDALDYMYQNGLPGDRWAILKAVAEAVEDTGGRTSDQLVDIYTAYCAEKITPLIEQSPLPPMLARLKGQGISLFINTATPQRAILPIMEQTGWMDLFDGVYGEPATKDDNLKSIMVDLGLDKDQIALVGDGAPDQKAAELVGCKFLKVDDGAGALWRMGAQQAGDFLLESLGLK